jgi:hypothetical protein
MSPQQFRTLDNAIKAARHNIYPYLDHDTPSGDPDACMEACRESDGEWVRYEDVMNALLGPLPVEAKP